MKIMATSFKRCHAGPATVSALTLQQATTNPRLQQRLLDTHGQVLVSLLWVTAPFSWALVCTRFCCESLIPQSESPRVRFPSPVDVLAALWWVNGELLQEGSCHTQVYCTQSPCSCGSPLLTCISSGHTQRQFCLSLRVAPGPGVHRVRLSPLSVSGRCGV